MPVLIEQRADETRRLAIARIAGELIQEQWVFEHADHNQKSHGNWARGQRDALRNEWLKLNSKLEEAGKEIDDDWENRTPESVAKWNELGRDTRKAKKELEAAEQGLDQSDPGWRGRDTKVNPDVSIAVKDKGTYEIGQKYTVKLKGKKIGHIGGFGTGGNPYPPDGTFEQYNTFFHDSAQGQGLFQTAIAQVASEWDGGVMTFDFGTSSMMQRAIKKVPGITRVEDDRKGGWHLSQEAAKKFLASDHLEHADHNQKDHGNWARGLKEADEFIGGEMGIESISDDHDSLRDFLSAGGTTEELIALHDAYVDSPLKSTGGYVAGIEFDATLYDPDDYKSPLASAVRRQEEKLGLGLDGEAKRAGTPTVDGGYYEPESEPDMDEFIRNHYPQTDWIDSGTGFVLADGKALDMSHGSGMRADDHRSVIPTESAMKRWGWSEEAQDNRSVALFTAMEKARAIRVMVQPDSLYIDMQHNPTSSQRRAISNFIQENRIQDLTFDVTNGVSGGRASGDAYGAGELWGKVADAFDELTSGDQLEHADHNQKDHGNWARSPKFKRWFGDSKVVDEKGEPLVVYHGSRSEEGFSTFDRPSMSAAGIPGGHHFTQRQEPGYGERHVFPVFLSMQNPLVVDYRNRESDWYVPNKHSGRLVPKDIPSSRDIREAGHDGVIIRWQKEGNDQYIVFSPNQIKSATGNSGEFSLDSDDITEHADHNQKDHGNWARGLEKYGYSQDNPHGGWLESDKKHARKVKAKRPWAVSGSVTGTATNIPVPIDALLELPGQNNEHDLIPDSPTSQEKIQRLADDIGKNGLKYPLLVWVDVDGEASIAEGNHRARAIKKLGKKTVDVEFRWFAGSEEGDHKWSAESIASMLKDNHELNHLEHADHNQKDHGNWARGMRKADSPKLERWLGKSKIVDEDGEPIVLYHGTTQTFTDFDTDQFDAAAEGNFGAGIYLTNQTDDADNYAGIGPDMRNKIERRVEQLMNEAEDNETMNGEPFGDIGYNDQELKAREIATEELVGHGGAIMPLFVRMEEPFYVGGDKDTYLDVIIGEADYEGRTPDDPDFDPDTAEFTGEESGKLIEFLGHLKSNMNDYDDGDFGKVMDDLSGYSFEGGKASEILKTIRNSEGMAYITDYDNGGMLVGAEVLRKTIEDTGFDGIVDSNVNNKFGTNVRIQGPYGMFRGRGMPGVDPDTVHYIVFKDNQVKSSTGNSGEFSLDSDDITEHSGPGAHPSGSPQQAHAGNGGGSDGGGATHKQATEAVEGSQAEIDHLAQDAKPYLIEVAVLDLQYREGDTTIKSKQAYNIARREARNKGGAIDQKLMERREEVYDQLSELIKTKGSVTPEEKDALLEAANKHAKASDEASEKSTTMASKQYEAEEKYKEVQREYDDLDRLQFKIQKYNERVAAHKAGIRETAPAEMDTMGYTGPRDPKLLAELKRLDEDRHLAALKAGDFYADRKIAAAEDVYNRNLALKYAELHDKATIDYAVEPQLREYFPSTYKRRTGEGSTPAALKDEERDIAKILRESVEGREGLEAQRLRQNESVQGFKRYREEVEARMEGAEEFSSEWWDFRNEANEASVTEREGRMLENQLAVSVAAYDEEIAGFTPILEKVRDEIDPTRITARKAERAARRKKQGRWGQWLKSNIPGDWGDGGDDDVARFVIPDAEGIDMEFTASVSTSSDFSSSEDDVIAQAWSEMGEGGDPLMMSFMFSEKEAGTGLSEDQRTGETLGGGREVFKKVGELVKEKLREGPTAFSFTSSGKSRTSLYKKFTEIMPLAVEGYVGVANHRGAEEKSDSGTFAFVKTEVWRYLSENYPEILDEYVLTGEPAK